MYPMSYSFKIQNIFSKLTEFITLKFLAHKVRELGYSRAIPDCQCFFFDLVREEKNIEGRFCSPKKGCIVAWEGGFGQGGFF